jgi:hypothetical protein
MWIWTGLPWSWVLVLTGVVGGALVLVHLLRPRPRHMKVITTMFWQEASIAVRGGRLGGRPSQWLSLLLLLAALLLGAFALRAPAWMSPGVRPVVLVIDNGLPSGAVESFDHTVGQLVASDDVAVAMVAAAPLPRLLQAPGHADGRGLHRLGELSSTSAAATGPSLQLAGALSEAMGDADITVVTRATKRWRDAAEALNMLDDVRVVQVGTSQSNTAVIGVTWHSDRPLSVQGGLTVRVGAWLQYAGDIQLRLIDTRDGHELAQRTVAQSAGASRFTRHFDIAAQGQALSIVVEGPDDSLAADNVMNLTLPARRRVIARPGPQAPAALLAALEAAGCLVEEPPSPPASGQIELWLEDDAGPTRAGLIQVVTDDADRTPNPRLVPVQGTGWADDIYFGGVRLPQIDDGTVGPGPADKPMVMVGDHPVAWLALNADDTTRIVLDDVWFNSQATAAASGGFAVMLSRAVTRALHIAPEPATASAERGLDDLPWLREQSQMDATAWLAAPGSPSVSNLLGRTDTVDTLTTAAEGWRVRGRAGLMALAIGLIVLSWWLFERGRIA